MKVLKIIWEGCTSLRPHDNREYRKKYWQLNGDLHYQIWTDVGMCEGWLKKDWVTDLRSGSSSADIIIPKDGNTLFRIGIFNHDASYTGWIDRALSDELLRAVWMFCRMGISGKMAYLGWVAVRLLGWAGYYKDERMPPPYEFNRMRERVIWHKDARWKEISDDEVRGT